MRRVHKQIFYAVIGACAGAGESTLIYVSGQMAAIMVRIIKSLYTLFAMFVVHGHKITKF